MTDTPEILSRGAGGLLIRHRDGKREIALIRRERYGREWALPKGKLQDGEDWQEAAIREVREETGYQVVAERIFGYDEYTHQGTTKLVMYWLMQAGDQIATPDPTEIEEVAWLPLDTAAARLTHEGQRRMVERLHEESDEPTCKIPQQHNRAFFLSSEEVRRNRLAANITSTCSELVRRLDKRRPSDTNWAVPASQLLRDAEQAMHEKDVDSGWTNVNAARRLLLFAMDAWELEQYAEVLRQESVKLDGWRQKAVHALLGNPENQQDPPPYQNITVDRVFQCSLIVDGRYENQYLKIAVRRTNLKRMFLILLSIAGLLPLLACLDWLPDPLSNPGTLLALEGFGAMGASFSVAITLTSRPLSEKIPEQLLGSFITWMRPVIGAVAALAAYLLLLAGWLPEVLFVGMEQSFAAMLAVAFLAGFSERLVVGVIEKKGEEA